MVRYDVITCLSVASGDEWEEGGDEQQNDEKALHFGLGLDWQFCNIKDTI
jgi:hypothetical protein